MYTIWNLTKQADAKNSKSGDSYLSCILLIICNRLPAHKTPLLSNASCSSSRSFSLPLHPSSLPSSSTLPLPLLDNPHYLSLNQTLCLTNPTLLERQRKNFNEYTLSNFVIFVEKNDRGQYMRFYRVLERVRDKIQRKYFCERGLGRGANSEGIIIRTGTSLEVEHVGLPPSIRRQFQLVEQSPRVLQWYLLLPCLH